jgi:hypothetical protein
MLLAMLAIMDPPPVRVAAGLPSIRATAVQRPKCMRRRCTSRFRLPALC